MVTSNNVLLLAENVVKHFGQGRTQVAAVQGVNLEIRKGEIVLIMGPSGSGKTTLLSILGGLLRPSDGRIVVDGQVISSLPESKLPDIRLKNFGFIFQDFNLLSALTVRENVEVVLNLAGVKGRDAKERAEGLLCSLDLTDRLNFRPAQLSGGEKQRVAIARALANDPAVILADEPTANLDSRIGHEVMRTLRKIAREQGRSVIIVSHDQRIKDIADRVLWLEDGEFKAIASRAEDPVCRMSVDCDAAFSAEYQGQTYYFCAQGCRSEFLADPARFLSGARRPRPYDFNPSLR
ncbi:MAG: ATP-binding cassette domain-containing protein [Chloroflexi bacterium]|nr:ATP-binding cassette domain-containing protein [Chloroflexota bacterium]